MRLLVVSQYFWPENFRVNDLVSELAERGHEVTVLTGVPNYPGGEVFPEYRRDPQAFGEHAGAAVVRVPMLARGRGAFRLALNYASFAVSASTIGAWRLRGLRFDAAFVFVTSPVTVCMPAVVQRRLKGVPIAYWILDQWPETLVAVGAVRSRFLLGAVAHLVRFLYRRSDLIWGQSQRLVEQIKRYCRPDQRVEHMPNWAESVFDGRPVDPAPEVPAAPGCFDVMFAGNVGESQDFPAILAAAEMLRDRPIRWLIVGDGRLASWVSDQVRARGLEGKVLMLGRFPLERMPAFYAHADALLVSLRADPIFAATVPGKVQSYLAAGVPIIGMLDGEGAEVIMEAGAGIACAAGDARGLADAVETLNATSPEARVAMGARGRAFYLERFERSRIMSRFESELLALSQRGAD